MDSVTREATEAPSVLIDTFTDAERASRLYTLTYEAASLRGSSGQFRCIALDVMHARAVVEARIEAQHGRGALGDWRLMRATDEPLRAAVWAWDQRAETLDERMERRAVYALHAGARADAVALMRRVSEVLQ